LWYRWIRLSCY